MCFDQVAQFLALAFGANSILPLFGCNWLLPGCVSQYRALCGNQCLAISVGNTNYMLQPLDGAVAHLYPGARNRLSPSWQDEECSIHLAVTWAILRVCHYCMR